MNELIAAIQWLFKKFGRCLKSAIGLNENVPKHRQSLKIYAVILFTVKLCFHANNV